MTPMIHVPDVRAAVDWYRDIGFGVRETFGNGRGGLSFAILSFGQSEVMFNQGGRPSDSKRREVDLYIEVDSVDDIYDRLKDRVEIVSVPYDAFHGMREFIIRDLNRFWITFGHPTAFEMLMWGVRKMNAETVRAALNVPKERGGPTPQMLSAAVAVAANQDNPSRQIIEALKDAGAAMPPEIELDILQSYVGKYKGEGGFEFEVTLDRGILCGGPIGDPALSLIAIDNATFRPIAFNAGTITFEVESGTVKGCDLRQGTHVMKLMRVADN